jgi:hypothetical protein
LIIVSPLEAQNSFKQYGIIWFISKKTAHPHYKDYLVKFFREIIVVYSENAFCGQNIKISGAYG